jgi:CelD/BcsL family acetyltransferase involved in cellulose biosynthesis
MTGLAALAAVSGFRVTEETLESLDGLRPMWPFPFVMPGWMRAWQEVFKPPAEFWIRSFWEGRRLVGIAPLLVENRTARLIGDSNVCDHLDLVSTPERAAEFCRAVLDYVRIEGIERLELNPLRPDSTVMAALVPAARKRGYPVFIQQDDVLFDMALPGSWDDYLQTLSGKQRHEVRRKLRRLESNAASEFRISEGRSTVSAEMDEFIGLFRQNRKDKAAFMDERMETYFRLLVEYVPEMRIGLLYIDGMPAAGVLCCDHESTRYLYNSGYNERLSHLSVGILCKILSIQEGIARGLKRYDFLKGNEAYKRQLGGSPAPIYRCTIGLTGN